ncbi:hypothetical protein [Streptomyces sp. NPDC050982]|uniref:hypothetical protein n=1 Tax=Streptomyces sp. NPDC050982 TaxID=3154746 RepID=UPI0033EBC422
MIGEASLPDVDSGYFHPLPCAGGGALPQVRPRSEITASSLQDFLEQLGRRITNHT